VIGDVNGDGDEKKQRVRSACIPGTWVTFRMTAMIGVCRAVAVAVNDHDHVNVNVNVNVNESETVQVSNLARRPATARLEFVRDVGGGGTGGLVWLLPAFCLIRRRRG
jgi:hypothetical protein